MFLLKIIFVLQTILSKANNENKFSEDKKENLVFVNILNNFFLLIKPKFLIFGFCIFFPTVTILKLLDTLDNCEDVQAVYSNFEINEDILKKIIL